VSPLLLSRHQLSRCRGNSTAAAGQTVETNATTIQIHVMTKVQARPREKTRAWVEIREEEMGSRRPNSPSRRIILPPGYGGCSDTPPGGDGSFPPKIEQEGIHS
jgi:hypothetical protein